jgi:hypothetical protein
MLWHYTCKHVAARIDRAGGVLRPVPQFLLTGQPVLVWLTDLAVPDPDALGLTANVLTCDRTEIRYAVPWPERVRPWIEYRDCLDPTEVALLEIGHDPVHWFISERRQRGRRSPQLA